MVSDDGRAALIVIAFVGSVFSPYYARSRRRSVASANPLDHCALNAAIYPADGSALWSLTERASDHGVARSDETLSLGASSLRYDRHALVVEIDERTAHVARPLGRSVRGRIEIDLGPHPLAGRAGVELAAARGRHHWWPIAPCARADVRFERPRLRFRGSAYHDANGGTAPLESAFARWSWSRLSYPGGDTAVLYEITGRRGASSAHQLLFAGDGSVRELEPLQRDELPRSRWGIARPVRHDAGCAARVLRTLEDTPFYSRSLLEAQIGGATARGIHESLDLDRFAASWVQQLLRFRMRRRRWLP